MPACEPTDEKLRRNNDKATGLGTEVRLFVARLLSEAGFETAMVTEETSENRPPRVFFVGHRQSAE